MKTYEYKTVVHINELPESYLNELGEQGWDLVNYVVTEIDSQHRYIFKKEKSSKKLNG